jgi:FixJ family two-component response regulator
MPNLRTKFLTVPGAVDFVEKPFRRETIFDSVRAAQDRLTPFNPPENDDSEAARSRLANLSDRESEVLAGLVAGLPNDSLRPWPQPPNSRNASGKHHEKNGGY